MTTILFDVTCNYSYVFVRFDLVLILVCDVLDSPVHMSTLVRDSMVVTHVYCVCSNFIYGFLNFSRFYLFRHA